MCVFDHIQRIHNQNCPAIGISFPRIQAITNRYSWCGVLNGNDGFIYNSKWKANRFSGTPYFPLAELNTFDGQHNTRLAFKADIDFDDRTLRWLWQEDSVLSDKLNQYFWDCIDLNEVNNNVLLAVTNSAADVSVCISSYLRMCLIIFFVCSYTESIYYIEDN